MWNLLLIGWITISSSVGGADVMVDEQDGIRMQGKQTCLQVETGRHLIMVDKNGYEPYIDTMTVRPNQNVELNVWLQPKNTKKEFTIRWGGIGGGLGTGVNIHISIANMRIGWFTLEPCVWGMNMPFFSGLSHVKSTWIVPQRDKRSDDPYSTVATSSPNLQFYYTPLLGTYISLGNLPMAFTLSAGPQISWSNIHWSKPEMADSFQFDPIWFSLKAGMAFKGVVADFSAYFKYQDGYFIGVEYLF